jgi:hypothetical protein
MPGDKAAIVTGLTPDVEPGRDDDTMVRFHGTVLRLS